MNPSNAPVALVTGAARRIGRRLCQRLHADGYRVLIHFNASADEAQTLADELNQTRADSAHCLQAALLETAAINTLAEAALKQWGRLDVLINNASSFYPNDLGNSTEAQWQDLMGSNLKAPFFLSQALTPALKASQGCIINMVDIHAQTPLANHSIYSSAKAGLAMLTQSLAKDLAPDVRVNGIAPGPILWPEGETDTAAQQAILAKTPLARMGCPDDIADTALFLIKQNFITGQIIAVDGGKSLYS